MTPKEKAEQLVQKYYVEVLYGNASDYSERMLRVFKIKAKNCALTVVDECIKVLGERDIMSLYWLKVKEEIENL